MRLTFEKVPKPWNASFGCLRFRGNRLDCPYHQHPEIELLAIERSSGRMVIGDTPDTFRAGQFFLFASNLPHFFRNDHPPTNTRSEAWWKVIQFLPGCLGAGFWNLPETRSIGRLLQRAQRGLRWERQSAHQAAEHLEEVFATTGAARIARLIDLLDFLAASHTGRPLASSGYCPVSSAVDSERMARVLGYIDRELGGEIDVATAARRAGLSPSGLSRFFSRHMGSSLMDYVISRRLMEARRLLIETDFTIAEICFRCGFQNLSNFNRHFLRRHRFTPSAFRRRLATNQRPAQAS